LAADLSFLNEQKSAASFCFQVAAWMPDMFCNFYIIKYQKIAKHSTTTKLEKTKQIFGILRITENF
jgi:hypothetical protein